MMDRELAQKLEDAVWITVIEEVFILTVHFFLFNARRPSIAICPGHLLRLFGTLKADEFAVMDMNGASLSGSKPSKEWPLHLKVYQKKPGTGAVIHTHGTYGVLWSFVPAEDETDVIPDHTPYLKMKLGKVGLVPYEKPGSQALFDAFEQRVMDSDGYLLKQHGAVVPGKSLMDAFFCLEELEESARIAWMLRQAGLR